MLFYALTSPPPHNIIKVSLVSDIPIQFKVSALVEYKKKKLPNLITKFNLNNNNNKSKKIIYKIYNYINKN